MSSNDGTKWATSKISLSVLCLLIIITIIVLIVVYWSKIYDLINPNKSNKPNNGNNLNESTSATNGSSSIGTPPYTCLPSQSLYNGSCYNPCSSLDVVKQDLQKNPQLKFDTSGSLCISECSEGSTDYGVTCEKPSNYLLKNGRQPNASCPAGLTMTNTGCANYNGIEVITHTTVPCKPDEQLIDNLCYPKCKVNYHINGYGADKDTNNFLPMCVPNQGTIGCPAGFNDINEECYKKSYSRGPGFPLTCGTEDIMNAGLCYPKS